MLPPKRRDVPQQPIQDYLAIGPQAFNHPLELRSVPDVDARDQQGRVRTRIRVEISDSRKYALVYQSLET